MQRIDRMSTQIPGREPRHRYILNPFGNRRWTRCPQCDLLTRLRKVPLLIQIDTKQLVVLRKSVRTCSPCDLLIAHKDDLEGELAFALQGRIPGIVGRPYRVLGTIDVADWKEGLRAPGTLEETFAQHHPFLEVGEIYFPPGGRQAPNPAPEGRASHAPVRRSGRRTSAMYQLKITLEHVRPQIWRRIVVPANIRLSVLHHVIQTAMGWTDSHLHSFDIAGVQYTMPYDEADFAELNMQDERPVRLSSLIWEVKDRFRYEYDFGDDWQHCVELEEIAPSDPEVRYPLCLAGKRACPPEDCGGPEGYLRFLRILKNPKHSEHLEMREWVGPQFEPDEFDLERVNRKLLRLRRQ